MQYSLLEDVWAPKKKPGLYAENEPSFDSWRSKECERTRPRRIMSHDTAARRVTVPGARQALPDCMPQPVGEPSNLRSLLSTIYNEQGPDVFVSLLPKPFVQDLTQKQPPHCSSMGKMYTRQGVFNEPEDPYISPNTANRDYRDYVVARPATYEGQHRGYPRPPSYYNRDEQVINVVLYAVTLGLVALVIIDTIMRFKR